MEKQKRWPRILREVRGPWEFFGLSLLVIGTVIGAAVGFGNHQVQETAIRFGMALIAVVIVCVALLLWRRRIR